MQQSPVRDRCRTNRTFGLIVEYPAARIYALSEEHGHVDLSDCADRPEVGEVVTVIPNHACGCTNMPTAGSTTSASFRRARSGPGGPSAASAISS